MSPKKILIDLDRGCFRRQHPSGIMVTMYRDEPGVFYDDLGGTVSAEVAKEAGFDTSSLLAEREKQRRIAEAKEKIERQFLEEQERIARETEERADGTFDSETDGAALTRVVRGSKRGLWDVVDRESGSRIKVDLTRKAAEEESASINARGYIGDVAAGDVGDGSAESDAAL